MTAQQSNSVGDSARAGPYRWRKITILITFLVNARGGDVSFLKAKHLLSRLPTHTARTHTTIPENEREAESTHTHKHTLTHTHQTRTHPLRIPRCVHSHLQNCCVFTLHRSFCCFGKSFILTYNSRCAKGTSEFKRN